MSKLKVSGTYESIPQKIKDAIVYFLAMFPRLSHEEIANKVEKALISVKPTVELVKQVAANETEHLDEISQGGVEAVKLGITLRQLPYATLHGRVQLLHEIIEMGKNGYMVETISPRGELIEVNQRDLRAALEANKQLSSLMERVEAATAESDDSILVDTYDLLNYKS